MAKITINIKDAIFDEVVDAFAARNGYRATIRKLGVDVPNTQTKEDFVEGFLKQFILDSAAIHQAQAQAQTIEQTIKNRFEAS
jgi:hypothetical protein